MLLKETVLTRHAVIKNYPYRKCCYKKVRLYCVETSVHVRTLCQNYSGTSLFFHISEVRNREVSLYMFVFSVKRCVSLYIHCEK